MFARYFQLNFVISSLLLALVLVVGRLLGMQLPDFSAFLFPLILCTVTGFGYWFYTAKRANINIAQTCLGLFSMGLFLQPGVMFSYVTLRLQGPKIDEQLSYIDHLLGFDWMAITATVATFPGWLLQFASTVYVSSLLATAVTIFVIGMIMEKPERVHQFVTHFIFTGLACSFIGGLIPADGYYVYQNIPADVMAAIKPVVGYEDMNMINAMRYGSLNVMHVKGGLGVVSFPSFHVALSLLLIWMCRGTGWVFYVALIWNVAIILCTPIMGNHYIADVAGGGIVAAASIYLVNRVYQRLEMPGHNPLSAKFLS